MQLKLKMMGRFKLGVIMESLACGLRYRVKARLLFLLSLSFSLLFQLQAQELQQPQLRSPVQSLNHFEKQSSGFQPYFIELFTSQGCSSCPPADAWLSEFTQEADLWQNYFPIAFHVTYWDYIGWKDPYGSRKYSQRQYDHLNNLNIRQVYTPQFVVNGKEWKGWFNRFFGNTFKQKPTEVGKLTVQLHNQNFSAEFNAVSDLADKKVTIHIALLGEGLTTQVTSGENSDKQLIHDFTVLQHQSFLAEIEGSRAQFIGQVESMSEWTNTVPQLALMSWVEVDSKPKQAVAAWLD